MKPYFEENGFTIYHGDCRDVLPSISKVDSVVTDPPYGDTSLDWDRMVRGWLDACEPLASSLWCFGSLRMFMEMARTGESSRWSIAQDIIWEKQNGSGFIADRFKRVHEHAVQFFRGPWSEVYKSPVFTQDATARTVRRKQRPPHMGGIDAGSYKSIDGGPRMMRSVIYAANCHGKAIHPTQKPVEIIIPLLRYSIPPGGVVVDPFMGSGSILAAAAALEMRGVGIEVDERYCELAAIRLASTMPLLRGVTA